MILFVENEYQYYFNFLTILRIKFFNQYKCNSNFNSTEIVGIVDDLVSILKILTTD